MSTVRNEDYWETVGEGSAELPAPESPSGRRLVRHLPYLYAGALAADGASDGPPENDPSLATCKRSPISGAVPRFEQDLTPAEVQGLKTVFKLGVEDGDRAVRIVAGGGDRLEAVYAALDHEPVCVHCGERVEQDHQQCDGPVGECEEDRRREKVLRLLERDEVGHAKRLATCGRRSIRLECPDLAGGCGYDENYVPVHCDSPLCPTCASRRTGQIIEKWVPAVRGMERPTFGTFTIENVEEPEVGREKMIDALGKLRRRTIPFQGSTVREREDGSRVTKRWCWWQDGGKPAERWKVKLQEDGCHDLVRHLERKYVNYEWEDVTGKHRGRAIPFEELANGGLYGIDVKQVGPNEYNVHAHLLMDSVYIPQAALSAVWEDITGDPVVDVRRIYDRGKESLQEALQETVGYAVKPPEFETLDDEIGFVQATKGAPLVHPFGSLHGSAEDGVGDLLCARCENTPAWWNYLGMVADRRDNMGKAWEVDGDRPPPENE